MNYEKNAIVQDAGKACPLYIQGRSFDVFIQNSNNRYLFIGVVYDYSSQSNNV
jgi:hypothetical protein